MAYTYNDFVSAANGAGLMSSFSSADIATAKKFPEFGISLLSLKQDYANATTNEAKTLAHSAAEALRESYGNYSGGTTGSEYVSGGLSPSSYQNGNQDKIDSILSEMSNYGDFSYDPESDPSYIAMKKSILRDADRTMEDTLGTEAAQTGGIANTAAVTAASQAADLKKSQLTDNIPTLEQNAYGEWADRYNRLGTSLAALQNQDDTDYGRLIDQISSNTDKVTTQQDVNSTAGWSMLESGVMPSAEQLAAMGITSAQASAYITSKTATTGGDGTYSPPDDPGSGDHVLNGVTLTDAQYAAYEALASGTYTASDFAAIVQSGAFTAAQLKAAGYASAGTTKSVTVTASSGLASVEAKIAKYEDAGNLSETAKQKNILTLIEGANTAGTITDAEAETLLKRYGLM